MPEKSVTNRGELLHPSFVRGEAAKSVMTGSSSSLYDEDPEIINRGDTQPTLSGLTVFTASVFVIGEMAGSGVVALPAAMVNAGFIGFVLLVLGCLASGYCGVVLARCWTILRARHPEYQQHVREPYPAIGRRAVGKWGAIAVNISINITLLGVCIVFLILASQNLNKLITTHIHVHFLNIGNNSLRIWILICAAVLLPCSWLGTPKEFWAIAIGASSATALACLLICVAIGVEMPSNISKVPEREVSFLSFFSAFGTILFSFGGASTFPTIQTDMRYPERFPLSVVFAYIVVLSMYLPVSLLGFFAYGANVEDNILLSVSHDPRKAISVIGDIVLTLITLHLLFSFVIVLNPVSQHFEEFFNIPRSFGWKRCLLRTGLMVVIIGVAELVPNFGPILSLIGGSTVTLLTFVFPCWFYLKIQKNIPLHTKAILCELILIGVVGGVASTYSAIDGIRKAFKI